MIDKYQCTACGTASAVELVSEKRLADAYFLYATCPACGARNPEGVREQHRDERNIAILTVAVLGAITVGAYFVPWIAIVYAGLFVGLHAILVVKQVTWRSVLNLAQTLAIGAFTWFVPRWAFLLPAIPTILGLVKRRQRSELDQPWQRTAEELRFFDDPRRRP